ncbi:MAG: GntR family transcriptional regulator [Lysobacterales bacterium]
MSTKIVLSQADARPIYAQIIDEISHRVALGDWEPGFALPSIRELAAELSVSVITVKRAYLELERAGVITTRHGKGSFVSQHSAVQDARRAELERLLGQTAALAAAMQMTDDELITLLQQMLKQR